MVTLCDLNGLLSSYDNDKDDDIDNVSENPLDLLNIQSLYYDVEDLVELKPESVERDFEYTVLHLNIQSSS